MLDTPGELLFRGVIAHETPSGLAGGLDDCTVAGDAGDELAELQPPWARSAELLR